MADVAELDPRSRRAARPGAFDDFGPNGLQVPGRRTVERVVTGVTAQRELFERAVGSEAQLVLVHHGLFWDFAPAGLDAAAAPSACGCCSRTTSRWPPTTCRSTRTPRSATTRCWPRRSGAAGTWPFARDRPRRRASPATASPPRSCSRACASVTGREPLVFGAGPARGAPARRSSPARPRAASTGASRRARRVPDRRAERARDGATRARRGSTSSPPATTRPRRSACAALGDWLADRFGVQHMFVDIPNPV